MERRRPKLAIMGEVGSQNLGDALIAQCMKGLLRDRDVDVVLADIGAVRVPNTPSDRSSTYSIQSHELVSKTILLLRGILRSVRLLRRIASAVKWYFLRRRAARTYWQEVIGNADGVIIGGGHLLTDRDFGFPPRIAEVARLCRTAGKPYAFFGCGADTLGLVARTFYRRALRGACYISVRDERSRQIVERIAPATIEVRVHPDPAFCTSRYFQSKLREETHGTSALLTLNVQPVQHFQRFAHGLSRLTEIQYMQFWERVVIGAQERGLSVRILTNGDPSDWAFARRLTTSLRSSIELSPRPSTVDDWISMLSGSAYVVCTRMHCGIAAFSLGSQVVPIGWDAKVAATWKEARSGVTVAAPEVILSSSPWRYVEHYLEHSDAVGDAISTVPARVDLAIDECLRNLNDSSQGGRPWAGAPKDV